VAVKKKSNHSDSASEEPSFEESLEQLEVIVGELEEGQIGLAESLKRYEDGVRLLKRCYGLLESAERRIELVSRIDADGSAQTEPFDDQATAERQPARAQETRKKKADRPPTKGASRRKPKPMPPDDGVDEPPGLF